MTHIKRMRSNPLSIFSRFYLFRNVCFIAGRGGVVFIVGEFVIRFDFLYLQKHCQYIYLIIVRLYMSNILRGCNIDFDVAKKSLIF
jgi:hypothetical protein